jgi:hypothetical protein
MSSGSWYRVDPHKVAHETIDGEVIMIHLVLGTYFSLNGVGADLWEALTEGWGRKDTLALLHQRYEGEPELIEATVQELLGRLAREELVEPASPEGNGAAPTAPPPGQKRRLEVPELEKYTDMQDFLLVDPIHEVDETGWPSQKQGA